MCQVAFPPTYQPNNTSLSLALPECVGSAAPLTVSVSLQDASPSTMAKARPPARLTAQRRLSCLPTYGPRRNPQMSASNFRCVATLTGTAKGLTAVSLMSAACGEPGPNVPRYGSPLALGEVGSTVPGKY